MNAKLSPLQDSKIHHTDSYKDIFNQRGQSYHFAMTQFPEARTQEFKSLIDMLNLSDGDNLIDIPSGGAYLSHYINSEVKIYSVDDAEQFIKSDPSKNKYCCSTTTTPFESYSFNKAYSLAGSHHMPSKNEFYCEVHRLLKPGGIFAYADVAQGSLIDDFLNVFVNKYNSMGHVGDFLNIEDTCEDLESSGFTVNYSSVCNYQWDFTNQEQAIAFFRNLFGLDLATDDDIKKSFDQYLNGRNKYNRYYIDWQLLQFKAIA